MTVPLDNVPGFPDLVPFRCEPVKARALCQLDAVAAIVLQLPDGTLTAGYTFLPTRVVGYFHVPTVTPTSGATLAVHGTAIRAALCPCVWERRQKTCKKTMT